MGILNKALTAIALTTVATFANANLLVNGDFDANVGLSGSQWSVYGSIAGWTALSGAGIEVERNTVVSAHSGNQYIELDSRNNSSMYQLITGLTAGASYELSFWYQARTNNGGNDNGINVAWGEYLPATEVLSIDDLTHADTPDWVEQTTTLVASASSMYLVFAADGISNSLGGFIDTVSLTATSVPEPASLALFSIGILGLILGRRKQHQI